MAQNYLLRYDQPCSTTVTNTRGETVTYSGYMGTDGQCHYFSKRVVDKAAFDGDRQVWADLTGSNQSTTTPSDTTTAKTGKGWDFANNLLNLASQYIGARQDTASRNVVVNVPEQQRKGLSTGAVIGIVAGVAVIGGIIYFVAKK